MVVEQVLVLNSNNYLKDKNWNFIPFAGITKGPSTIQFNGVHVLLP